MHAVSHHEHHKNASKEVVYLLMVHALKVT